MSRRSGIAAARRLAACLLVLGAVAVASATGAAADVLPSSVSEFGFRRGAFLARGMAARPVGMGEAFTAVADDASAVSWNPGGLGFCHAAQGLVQYDDAGNGLTLVYGAAAVPMGRQTVGVSITSLSYGSYDLRDMNGMITGRRDARDIAASFSLAAANPPAIGGFTGVAIEGVSEDVGGQLFGVSAGAVVPAGLGVRVGLAVLHIGTKTAGFSLPTSARAGVSWLASPRLRMAAEAGYGLTDKSPCAALGAELLPVRAIALRMGYGYRGKDQSLGGLAGFGAGAGVRFGRLGFDYAYQPFGDLGVSHRFALLYGLGGSALERQQAEFDEAHALALSTLGPRRAGETMISAELERDATNAYREAAAAYAAGDHDRAVTKATDAVTLNPFYWEAWQVKGNALYAKGDVQGAVAAFKKSLEMHPDNPDLEMFLTRIVPAASAPAKPPPSAASAPVPSGAAAATPSSDVQAASALYASGDIDAAWRKAAAVLTADRTNWEAWQIVGNCQYAKGDRAAAQVSYRESLRLHPDNPQLKAFADSLSR